MSVPANTANERPWPSEAYGWYVVFVLCVCAMVAFIDRQIINLLVEDIKADLAISDTQVSLLQGLAFALFYAIAAVPLGRLADTGNRRRVIAAGIVVWTIAAAACGLAKNFLQLFLARTVVGVGEATLTPSGFSMLGDLFRSHRVSLPVSVFTGASFVGSGVALLVGGWLIAQLSALDQVVLPMFGEMRPWEAAFVLGALPGFVVVIWFLLTVREPERRSTAATSTDEKPSIAEVMQFVRANIGVFVAVFFGISVLAAVQFCLGAWVPAHFIRNLGWNASQVGYAYGLIFLFCGTGGVIAGGWIADRLQARGMRDGHLRTACYAALVTVPFVIAFPMMTTAEWAVGAGPALIPVICPSRMRGLLVAMYLLIANIVGQAGGPLVVALFTDLVFGSPELVSRSLMVAPAMLLLGGALLVRCGFRGLRQLHVP